MDSTSSAPRRLPARLRVRQPHGVRRPQCASRSSAQCCPLRRVGPTRTPTTESTALQPQRLPAALVSRFLAVCKHAVSRAVRLSIRALRARHQTLLALQSAPVARFTEVTAPQQTETANRALRFGATPSALRLRLTRQQQHPHWALQPPHRLKLRVLRGRRAINVALR